MLNMHERKADERLFLTKTGKTSSRDTTGKLVNRVKGWTEQIFPKWMHRRHRHTWERKWTNPEFRPRWKTDQPPRELVDAVESGWFPKDQRAIDVGCGNGEVSRWLAGQGLAVLGLDYSAAAIENCRRLSAGQPNAPAFELADLCQKDLRLEPAFSLIDRGCFHRIVRKLRPSFAQNIARITVNDGHFLLIAGTFQDPRVVHSGGVCSDRQLREHVGEIFGDHFIIERAEPALINPVKGREGMPAVAFWMVRKSWCWICLVTIFQILADFLNEVAETSRPFLEIVEGLF
jgi:SAM-dependent methyltransferase